MGLPQNMDKPIIVLGTGTFGLSAAHRLAARGYTRILCLDRWPCPSPSSAGFDRNKIVRTAYADPLYVGLAQEALQEWVKPRFEGVFHLSGWVIGTNQPPSDSGAISISASGTYDKLAQNLHCHGLSSGVTKLPSPSSLHLRYPDFFSNTPGFRGMFDSNAGWVDSAKAMIIVAKECESLGVQFITGSRGTISSLVWDDDDSEQRSVIGVKNVDGEVFLADKIICCLGAYTDTLIDMENQTTAVAYSTTHIQLSEQEVEQYKDMPVIMIEGLGYTFPPDANNCIKFCDLHIGHPWKKKNQNVEGKQQTISIPRDQAYNPNDTLPIEDLNNVKKFISYCMPQFQNREFLKTKMCWDTETFDFNWIIDYYPKSFKKSLLIVTGGSGHSFKNFTNIGKYIVQRLELDSLMNPLYQSAWQWRPEKVKSVENIERVDLEDLTGWKHD